ncbi:MAG: Hpt domain-containing protein [Candidatus Aegiribacteria sp.]|nr:Hpt domain-containing protein [Candidatus Aegiribacteria sp.]
MSFEARDRAVFDPDDFIERMMGDLALAQSIAETFLIDIHRQIDVLKEKLDKDDSRAVELQSHCINGAAAIMAAEKFREVASAIEKAGRIDNLRIAVALIPELERELAVLEKEMRQTLL